MIITLNVKIGTFKHRDIFIAIIRFTAFLRINEPPPPNKRTLSIKRTSGSFLTYKPGEQMFPSSHVCPLVNRVSHLEITPFTTSFTLAPKKSLLTKSAMFKIVLASRKYEIWGSLQRHLEACLFYKKMQQNFLRSLSLW